MANVVLFSYGKRENGYVTCNVDFKVNENEQNIFNRDIEQYVERIEEDLRINNFIFELGRFCGKNDYKSILILLSVDISGRLIIELPPQASLNLNHYNDLKEFLEKQLGFEILN